MESGEGYALDLFSFFYFIGFWCFQRIKTDSIIGIRADILKIHRYGPDKISWDGVWHVPDMKQRRK
jgi:hypothetical protein